MRKTISILAIAVIFAAIIPAASAAIRVTYYPVTATAYNGTVFINWDDGSGGAVTDAVTLLYGTTSASCTSTAAAGSTGTFQFIPASIGMTGGIYYFRVSNDASDALSNEYSLHISKNIGLKLDAIKFSPNPFSPNLGGLNISYMPESDNKTNVKVTISVFTVAGRLIRTIVPGAMRTVGVVSNTDVWDGKDDEGRMARNGRYIIQCEVEDTTGKQQYLNTVILVK